MMEQGVVLRPVSPAEYGKVRELAETIWPVCYKDILSAGQIAYMMEMMYAGDVIAGEVAEGVRYCWVEADGGVAGYLAWGPLAEEPRTVKLHKLYLLPEKQRQGIGSRAIALVKQQVKAAGASRLRLNVNRQNANAIQCYTRNGFAVVQQENNDIGNGFFMIDYVMETAV